MRVVFHNSDYHFIRKDLPFVANVNAFGLTFGVPERSITLNELVVQHPSLSFTDPTNRTFHGRIELGLIVVRLTAIGLICSVLIQIGRS